MASIKDFLTVRHIFGLVVVPGASLLIDHNWGLEWLTPLLLTVYVTILFAIVIDHASIPRPYLGLRKLHAQAGRKAKKNPMLERYYTRSTLHTKQALQNIIDDRFEFDIETVPTLSIEAMELVDQDCLLTFPLRQSEALLVHKTGSAHQYDDAIKAASARIKGFGGQGVTRVFILARQDDISGNLIEFMRRNIDAGINVRVIFDEDMPALPGVLEAPDFGYYETRHRGAWVMVLEQSLRDPQLTRYIVDTKPERVLNYHRFGQELVSASQSFDKFMESVTRPVNQDLWPVYFAKNGFEMLPPHGLSDEDADYLVKTTLATLDSCAEATVVVLGFTPKLLRRLAASEVGHIISIDQSKIKPHMLADRIDYQTASWTALPADLVADAIMFDESINNLSKVQLGMFFTGAARVLKPGSVLVGRLMGRFEERQAERFGGLSEGNAVSLLRKIEGVAHSDYAPLIICLLHARSMGFDEALSVANCEHWNRVLLKLRDQGEISKTEYANWHLEFDFRLLSPEQETLLREANAAGFGLSELRDVAGPYTQKCADTADFYKILRFALLPRNEAEPFRS